MMINQPILSRSIKLARLFCLVSSVVVLSACQPTGEIESNLKFAPPDRILQVRAIDRTQLSPSVLLSNGTQIPMRAIGNNTWSGTILVQPDNSYFVTVEWIETLPKGNLVLAQWSQSVDVDADGAEINLSDADYDYNVDMDGDTVPNLEERQNNTDPFVHNDQINEPTDGETDGSSTDSSTSDGTSDADNETGSSDGTNTDNPTTGPTSSGSTAGSTDSGVSSGGTSSGSTDFGSSDSTSTGGLDTGSSSSGTTGGSTTAGSSDIGSSDSQGTASGGETTPETDGGSSTPQTKASVLIPRILPADAPVVDGMGVTLNGQDNLTGEWSDAVQFDDFGARLWIKNLMIDQDADASDGTELHRWAAMHDGVNLYVLVLTDDRGLREADSIDFWEDDSIELFIDGDNSKLTEWGDADDYQMIVPLLKQFSKKANNEIDGRFAPGPMSANLSIEFSTGPGIGPDGIRIAKWEQDVYEIVVPLVAAGIEIGAEFGLEIQLNDDDNGGFRDSKWGWFHPSRVGDEDTDRTYLDPSVMGTVILEE